MLKYKIKNIKVEKLRKQGVALVKKGEIKAVHDDDLEGLLKSLDVYDDVIQGKAKCYFCGNTITMENLECVFPIERSIQFCCSRKECYSQLLEGSDING